MLLLVASYILYMPPSVNVIVLIVTNLFILIRTCSTFLGYGSTGRSPSLNRPTSGARTHEDVQAWNCITCIIHNQPDDPGPRKPDWNNRYQEAYTKKYYYETTVMLPLYSVGLRSAWYFRNSTWRDLDVLDRPKSV